jgi:hypothetical protein
MGGSDKPEVFTMIADMWPKRLYLFVDMMLDLTVPFFRNTSHLFFADLNHEVESTSTQSGWPQLRNLPCLPALTHLALYHRISPHTLSTVLSDCSYLQTLILYGSQAATEHFPFDDQRVVIFLSDDLISEWNIGSEDGDAWARADLFILQKQRGDINGPFFVYLPLASPSSCKFSDSCYYLEQVEIPVRNSNVPASLEFEQGDPVQRTVLTSSNLPALPRFERGLEQKIFEHVAHLYPQMIPILLRVARRVLEWYVPVFKLVSAG